MRQQLRLGLASLLMTWLSGCQLLPASRIGCQSDSDCPTGSACNLETGFCSLRSGDAGEETDSGPVVDAGSADAGTRPDAGLSTDAGEPDAGTAADAGFEVDAGPMTDGGFDAGTIDAGTTDAGTIDAGTIDAGTIDAGTIDAGTVLTLKLAQGNNQSATVGTILNLAVVVTDASGTIMDGITVTWAVGTGGGSLSSSATSQTTGANGYAVASVNLGTVAGQQTFTASAPGVSNSPVTFTETAQAAAPVTLKYPANFRPLSGAVTEQLSLSALVVDQYKNPVSAFTVEWAAATGGGTFDSDAGPASSTTSTTDADGLATVTTTLGTVPGTESFQAMASVNNGSPLSFSVTVTAGAAALIALAADAGNDQTAVAGDPLASPFAVIVTDAERNPVSEYTVHWSELTGGGSIASTSVTGVDGIATARATLGTTAGENTFTAAGMDLLNSPLTFTATGTAGVQAQSKSSINATPGSLFADGVAAATITVTLEDANQNPSAGQSVVLETTGPANLLYPLSGQSNSAGEFLARLSSTHTGSVTVTARSGLVNLHTTVVFTNPSCAVAAFTNAVDSPLGMDAGIASGPGAVATGDFNGDGKLDLIVASQSGVSANVLLGNGQGHFTNAESSPFVVGSNPDSVAIGDFNGDGVLDLAFANANGNDPPGEVSVFLGNGHGEFVNASGSPIAVGTGPDSVATGDFNGDGNLDLVVANLMDSTVSVLLGAGNGEFANDTGSPFEVGETPISVAVGDLNGDGNLDLVVANQSNSSLSILSGDGRGNFSTVPMSLFYQPDFVTMGDFNGDGNLDLAVADGASEGVSLLLSTSDGGFSSENYFGVGYDPSSLTTGDFNGDGNLNLAVTNTGSATVTVLMGDGTGDFPADNKILVNVGDSPRSVVAGDFTGTGELDLAVANFEDNTVSVMLNQCAASIASLSGDNQMGTVGQSLSSPFEVQVNDPSGNPVSGATVLWTATTDLDGGYMDDSGIITPSSLTNAAGVASATARLGITPGVKTFTATTATSPSLTSAVSFTATAVVGSASTCCSSVTIGSTPRVADGLQATTVTVTVADEYGNAIPNQPVVLSATGPASRLDPLSGVTNSSGVFVAELTTTQAGDVTVNAVAGGIPLTSLTAVFNNPDCSTEAPDASTSPAPTGVGGTPAGVTAGDFNGDGTLDLAVVNEGSGNVELLFGHGDGGFTADSSGEIDVGEAPDAVATGDFNGDGTLDLAVANRTSGSVTVLLGNGSGGFTEATGSPITVGTSPAAVATADFNIDGNLDLAIANWGSNNVSVLLGTGTGQFTGSTIAVGKEPDSIATGDFNGDGLPDLAVANFNGSSVTIVQWETNGSFSKGPVTVPAEPSSVTTGDFNGDGYIDFAVTSESGHSVSIMVGSGNGTFSAHAGNPFAVGTSPSAVMAGDFNGDGLLDLAVTNSGGDDVTVLLGNGSGFTSAPGSPVMVGTGPTAMTIGDFTGNGALDLAVTNGTGDSVSVLLNECGGVFAPQAP